MPTFCRHNHLIQNCPICSREQAIEPRPLVSSSTPGSERAAGTTRRPASQAGARGPARSRGPGAGVTVRRVRTSVDDGYRWSLVPGLKSRADAQRLAEELAFAAARLRVLGDDPPGLYGEVARAGEDPEERTWLAFLIAYLGPLEDDDDPFSAIRQVRTSWASGDLPALNEVAAGPRTAHDPQRALQTLQAYRNWAERAGSQDSAYRGDPAWSPERRFARVFERLALPGLHRAARFDLLLTLGQIGVYELSADSLGLGGSDEVTLAAKRALGIGDSILLERRAAQLASACGLPLAALDLGFYNWERGERYGGGLPRDVEVDEEALDGATAALGL